MKLWTINRVLRAFGLVLVIETGHAEPTRFWIERARTFDRRAKQTWPAAESDS